MKAPLCLLASSIALHGLAAAQDAYLVDSNLDQLFSVNVTTGAATLIGSTLNNGLGTPADLTWRATTQQLWTIDLAGGEVGTLDVHTGTFRPVFTANPTSGWQAMAWDEQTRLFYLANQNGTNYVLDPTTGVTTALGAAGLSLITALDTDAAGNLFGIDFNGAVCSVDKTTGAATTLSTTISGFQGLGINHISGTWFAANTNDDSLYNVTATTGASTLIGAFGAGVQFSKGFDLVEKPIDAYMVDSNLDVLFAVDTTTGTATPIGSTLNNGLSTPADLTYRAATGQLWTIDLAGGEVGTLDVTNGTFTPVFTATPNSGWQAMAWDETTQRFYLANQNGSNYVLDPSTGVTSLLGAAGFPLITALDTDACGDLYGIDFNSGSIVKVNKLTGVATAQSVTLLGFQGLGIDQNSNRWYGANSTDSSLYGIQAGSGTATLIGAFGAGTNFPKGFDLVDLPRALLVDSNNDALYSVDLPTGAATFIAATNNNTLSTPADLSYVESTRTLWTIDLAGGAVGTLNPTTGKFTIAFQTGLSGWQGMAYDAVTEKFYLANQNGNTYALDPYTGVTTLLGATGAGLVTCLDTDGAGNLFGIDFSSGAIVGINKVTGAGTPQSTTIGGFQGLGIDHVGGTWYGSNTNDDSLHRVNATTGANQVIGVHGAGVGFAKGFDLVDDAGTTVAVNQSFGTACGNLQLTGLTRPVLCRSWDLGLQVPPSATLAAVAIGFSNPNLSLTPFGGTGCTQYADALALVFLFVPVGTPAYAVAMPSSPSYVGLPLFAQGLALVPGLNPLGVGASNGVRGTIGNF